MATLSDVKVGDRFTFLACYFQVPGWWDDQPCVLLSPILEYNEGHPWAVIENALINLVCDGELESEDADSVEECLKWAGKSIKSVKRAVSKALKTGKKPYKDVYSEILKMEVEIVEDEYGELTWRELNRKEI